MSYTEWKAEREETRTLQVRNFPVELIRQLRILGVELDRSLSDLLQEAARYILDRYGRG